MSAPGKAVERPDDYWDTPDPIVATIVNIKGQRRRETVYQMLTTGKPDYGEYWNEAMRQPALCLLDRRRMAAMHGTWIGGEDLPDYLPGELEIARLIIATVTLDVISIRARREYRGTFRPRAQWRYRMVDEYGEAYSITPDVSIEPLTYSAVVALIDGATSRYFPAAGRPLGDRLRGTMDPDEGEAFVQAESLFYPDLGDYVAEQARAWAGRRREELP